MLPAPTPYSIHKPAPPAYVPAPDPGYGHGGYHGKKHKGGGTSIYATPAAQAFNSYSRGERMAIQRRLRAAGYYHSSVDGAFGPGTYNAVVAYARDTGTSLGNTGNAYAVYDGVLY